MIEVSVNEKDLILHLDKLENEPLLDSKIMYRIVDMVKLFITQRTIAGRDVEGKMFEGYSETHKMFRESKGYQTGHVDLFMTGQMQASIDGSANVEGQRVIIDFADIQQASKAHGLHYGSTHKWGKFATVTIPPRHFFDISVEEMAKILLEVETYMNEKLEKL